MKGDFSRISYKPSKNFTRVLKQQGRVDLDSDFNELVETLVQLARRTNLDVIGPAGVPKGHAGFGVGNVTAGDFSLSAGRLYLEGIRLELTQPSSYLAQPFLPSKPPLTPAHAQTDLVFVDGWERHLTALEDPELLEVALGGPDTTTRTVPIWQVRVRPNVGNVQCDGNLSAFFPPKSSAILSNKADAVVDSSDPCSLSPQAGYRGLENRLYRVEVHRGGDANTATFKWSRDNGAVAFAVEELLPANQVRVKELGKDQVLALRVGDWVELSDDDSELAGNPGLLARITDLDHAQHLVTLSAATAGFSQNRHPKLRRWDQASDALPVQAGTEQSLEDGIKITFGGTQFNVGDYWVFAARTVDSSLEPLNNAPAMGIQHHYLPLALLTWTQNAESFSAEVQHCPPTFPPLTDIHARDVFYDPGDCDFPGAKTVQDVLDTLCKANDLRWHNRHLHGWGIVCGLQVECAPERDGQRRSVLVQPGYALDCEGNDLILQEQEPLDVLLAIERLQAQDPNRPILVEGNGEVCLSYSREGFAFERHDPKKHTLQSKLKDTLLMDFIEDCIQKPLKELQDFLKPDADQQGKVNPSQRQLIALINLAIQFFNPNFGRFVFLSKQEHDLLLKLYGFLRELLQSETFCAMFEDARPFPDYPFEKHGITTVFGKGFHQRLRLNPNGRLAYTIGGNRIHVYDLGREELIEELEFPGGPGTTVRDVAFSPRGDRMYAVATLKTGAHTDSLFAVAEVSGRAHKWSKSTVVCDGELVTLATSSNPKIQNLVYAVGLGKGLYQIDPNQVQPNTQPIFAIATSGHITLLEARDQTFAYLGEQRTPLASGHYNFVRGFELVNQKDAGEFPLGTGAAASSGQDDLLVVGSGLLGREINTLWVVVDEAGTRRKNLLGFNALQPGQAAFRVDLEEDRDSAIRLAHIPGASEVLVSCEDSYRIKLVDRLPNGGFGLVQNYHFPLQIAPISLAVSRTREANRVYALNSLSNTLSSIPAGYFNPANKEPLPTAGGPEFLKTLAEYRQAMINAYIDLTGGLLQYLKDCFCHHLLIDCPECEAGDKVYLGCVSIRKGEVYKICNFSLRKYVKSFPSWEYWISLVPVLPLAEWAVEELCCWILPDRFGRFQSPKAGAYQAPFKSQQLRLGLDRLQHFRLPTSRLSTVRSLTSDWALSPFTRPQRSVIPREAVLGRGVEGVRRDLEAAQIEVSHVEPYDPARLSNLNLIASPEMLEAGSRVKLIEQDGVVRHYALVDQESETVKEVRAQLDNQKATFKEMEAFRGELEASRQTLKEAGRLESELNTLRSQMAKVQSENQQLLTSRDKEISELKHTIGQLQGNLTRLDALQGQIEKLLKPRPEKPPRKRK